ncbi:hypothetical protein J1N35_043394 [Gossypium stocksii]|uniref:Uncharacterized protein n=1 Tax=Gossypium stocksii TaxID=47602 RepID=A0A9D3ZF11_9ROSI|nr:hypothetical protein J1N35_043394 [Gossypium stocksii]
MSWGGSSYTRGSSMYTKHQINAFFDRHMDYRRTNYLLISTRTNEGTSSPLFKGDNKGTDEGKDATYEACVGEEEGVAQGEDSESEPRESEDGTLDNAPDP